MTDRYSQLTVSQILKASQYVDAIDFSIRVKSHIEKRNVTWVINNLWGLGYLVFSVGLTHSNTAGLPLVGWVCRC